MSQSPTADVADPNQAYLDAWQNLAIRIRQGQSFSGRERNCCFLNTRGGRFADVSAAMGLDLIDDSRAVAQVDWDHDGDLDLWLANRTGPRVKYLENNLIEQPNSVSIRLIGDPSKDCSRDAIGARVRIAFASPNASPTVLTRTLYAGDAFLSQSSKWLHFGIPSKTSIQRVEIRWPGSIKWTPVSGVKGPGRYVVGQADGTAIIQKAIRDLVLGTSSTPPLPTETESRSTARVVLPQPKVVLPFQYDNLEGSTVNIETANVNRLITLWAPWCAPCLKELAEFSRHTEKIRAANMEVVAIDVDSLSEDYQSARAAASKYQKTAQLPFTLGLADEASLRSITDAWRDAMYRKRQPPLPSSFLIDAVGRLRVVYSGPVSVEQLLRDTANLDIPDNELAKSAIPFEGRSSVDEFVTHPISIASVYREELQFSDAAEYLWRYLSKNPAPPADDNSMDAHKQRRRAADVYHQLGRISMDQNEFDRALTFLEQALKLHGQMVPALIDLATCLQRQGNLVRARQSLEDALRQRPRNADAWNQLGIVFLSEKQIKKAASCFERSLANSPRAFSAANNLAWIRATAKSSELRNARQALQMAQFLASGAGADRPDVLDTLAAAYAENGDFENAVNSALRAIELASERGMTSLVQQIQGRLTLYRRSEPFRQN